MAAEPRASCSAIVLATGNAHKVAEMRAILSPLLPERIRLLSLGDIGLGSPPGAIERFTTFAANARAKAVWVAKESGLPSIADDSGICVDALGGAPGVKSARWAGPDASDRERCDLLLAGLQRVQATQPRQRSAKFVCACVLAIPRAPQAAPGNQPQNPETLGRLGSVRGLILFAPDGEGGFGYDPIFFVPRAGKSMAALGPEIKNQISHRARALRALAAQIPALMQ